MRTTSSVSKATPTTSSISTKAPIFLSRNIASSSGGIGLRTRSSAAASWSDQTRRRPRKDCGLSGTGRRGSIRCIRVRPIPASCAGSRRARTARISRWWTAAPTSSMASTCWRARAPTLRPDCCVVVVDVDGGWGGDTVARLKDNGIPVVGFRGAGKSSAKTRDRQLSFYNKRAEAWWRMREELDPGQDGGSMLALPPDASVKADLAAPRWELTARGIKIEDKNQIRKRLGRSPDEGDAIVMCLSEGTRAAAAELRRRQRAARPERANVGYAPLKGPGPR